MPPQRWREIEDLYHAALDRDPDARAALLESADPELRREVESLLEQDSSKAGALDRPAWEGVGDLGLTAANSTLAIFTAGARLGPYEILAPIGKGGMGEVYKARDTRLNRMVAVKLSKEQFSERFEREAKAVAALNHSNICQLYDVASAPSRSGFLVMEFVEGRPLRGPLPLEEALRIAEQIAQASGAAHENGIVHRDLKPANILLKPDPSVKVLDFGLAKVSPVSTLLSTTAGKKAVEGFAAVYADPDIDRTESFSGTQKIPGRVQNLILPIIAKFKIDVILEEIKGSNPCLNHAERKIERAAAKQTIFSISASRPVCQNCQMALWNKVDGPVPLGSNVKCGPWTPPLPEPLW